LVAGCATFPNDTIRRRLQQPGAAGGYLATAREIYGAGGLRRFYRGIGPTLVRAGPSAAIQFATFDILMARSWE